MDSISYFLSAFLLAVKIITISGDVIEYDDGSVDMTYEQARLGKSLDTLYITDGVSAFFVKNSDKLEMEHMKSTFEKDLTNDSTEISDGYSSFLNKYSDGAVETRVEESTLFKYEAEVDINHENSAKLYRDSEKVIIEDGVLGLIKDSEGSVTLYDKKASLIRYSSEHVSIREKDSAIEKESDGNVRIYHGMMACIQKDSQGTVDICHTGSYIRKYSDGEITVRNDNTYIINAVNGYAEVRDHKLFVVKDENGKRTISDGYSSIAKDSSTELNIKTGVSTIVKDNEGIKITLRLKPIESANLMVEIIDHILQVDSSAFSVFFKVKLPNRIKEEDVKMCFTSKSVSILVHRKKGSISCPKGTTRSESLKEYKK